MILRALAASALFLALSANVAAHGRADGRASPKCSAQPCVYIADGRLSPSGRYRLTGYLATANGNVAPVADLAGPATQLDHPWGIAVDRDQNIYVTNPGLRGDGYVTVYEPDATGDLAPSLKIGGGASNPLCYPFGIAVTSPTTTPSTVYVANAGCGGFVIGFGIDPGGRVTELGTISGPNTGIAVPWGVATDASDDVYVADYAANAITVYAHGAYGNVAPIRTIAGALTGLSGPAGLAVDPSGNLYVANFDGNTIAVFPALADGDVVPSALIAGSATGLNGPFGVALDAAAHLYVTNYYGPSAAVFAADQSGDVSPTGTIAGAKTQLRYPEGIAVLVPAAALRAP
jgi:6-phosphogluconolactonase (cycloisomerase 2 family)